jgi:hypothetical protein
MSVTANTVVIDNVPQDAYQFARQLEAIQPQSLPYDGKQNVLFNKGRYFETSVYNQEQKEEIANLTGLEIQHSNMFVASWKHLEDFVIACNIIGKRVSIDVDWI